MEKSKKNKTKVKSKSKALVKKTTKRKLLWLGAQHLMGTPKDAQEKRERDIILLTSKILKISPFGINILGNLPYINKLGLVQKAKEYASKVRFVYRWIHHSRDDSDKAICECKLMTGSKNLTDWITGECSPSSTKMSTLKGYQNHMAQTRAKNRAIYEAFGERMHREMMSNIEKAYSRKTITPVEIKDMGGAVSVSAEEIQEKKKRGQKEQIIKSETKGSKIEELKTMLKGNTDIQKKADLKKRTGIVLMKGFEMTDTHAGLLVATLLNNETK